MIKRIKRRCVVCGKKINVKIYEDRHYFGGHSFGKMKVHVGKGEYKKVGTSKLFNKTVDVVKWTGKNKEVEHWECNECFEEASHHCWLEQKIEELFGERCKDFCKDCHCCEAWETYDLIVGDKNRKKKR